MYVDICVEWKNRELENKESVTHPYFWKELLEICWNQFAYRAELSVQG